MLCNKRERRVACVYLKVLEEVLAARTIGKIESVHVGVLEDVAALMRRGQRT
jgi:hypothetical protein